MLLVGNRDQRFVGMRHWVMHLFCPVYRGRTIGVRRGGISSLAISPDPCEGRWGLLLILAGCGKSQTQTVQWRNAQQVVQWQNANSEYNGEMRIKWCCGKSQTQRVQWRKAHKEMLWQIANSKYNGEMRTTVIATTEGDEGPKSLYVAQ